MKKSSNTSDLLIIDLIIFLISIIASVFLVKTGVLVNILTTTIELEWIGSFIAGMFFTSVFTTTPAIVTLGGIAQVDSILATAIFGAMGAVVGDMVIFNFFHDKLSPHFEEIINYKKFARRFRLLIGSRYFKWLPTLIGGLIIASPLPDEMGIAFMSISKVPPRLFVIFSYIFNFIGILMIGLVAKAI